MLGNHIKSPYLNYLAPKLSKKLGNLFWKVRNAIGDNIHMNVLSEFLVDLHAYIRR